MDSDGIFSLAAYYVTSSCLLTRCFVWFIFLSLYFFYFLFWVGGGEWGQDASFKNETYHFVDIRNKTIALGFQCLRISDDLTVSEKTDQWHVLIQLENKITRHIYTVTDIKQCINTVKCQRIQEMIRKMNCK